MARIGPKAHLVRRSLLALLWLEAPQFLALLPPSPQREMHRLYAPSLDLTEDELLARVADASKRGPSLANRVGKHWLHVWRLHSAYSAAVGVENWPSIRFLLARDLAAMAGPDVEGDSRRVFVHPVMRAELDFRKPAHALRELGEQIRRSDEKDCLVRWPVPSEH